MLKAKDIMTTKIVTVTPQTSVWDLARLLTDHRINGVPVVDEAGKLVGIATEADLIDQSKKLHLPTVWYLLDSVIFFENPKKVGAELKKMAGSKVGDICSQDVSTVEEDTSIDEVATLMAEKRVNTIPIMRDDKIVGIVGRGDIVKAMLS